MHRLRSLPGALAIAACLCTTFVAAAPVALAAKPPHKVGHAQKAGGERKTGHRHPRHARTAVSCAKKSSFHSSGHIHRRHRRHHTSCAEHRSGSRPVHHARRHRLGAHRLGAVGHAHAGEACPGSDLQPTLNNIEAIRSATLCLVNQERADHGEATLQVNAQLQQSAQGHTESMAFGGYFEHDGPGGDTPLSRMIAAGYIPNSQVGYEIGENIGWGTLSLGTPRAIVAAWMASPGHRANILDAHFQDTAVGVSPHVPSSLGEGQAGGVYTQDFGVIIG